MKKLYISFFIVILLLIGDQTTFAVQTSLWIKCTWQQIFLNWNNVNNWANTNTKYLCFNIIGLTQNIFKVDIYNSTWNLEQTLSKPYYSPNIASLYAPKTWYRSLILETSNFYYISFIYNRYSSNAPDYQVQDSYNIIYNKSNWLFKDIIQPVTNYYWLSFTYSYAYSPGFTFDNNNIYLLNLDSNWNPLNYIIPINTDTATLSTVSPGILTTFKDTAITSYYYLNVSNELIRKNTGTPWFTIFTYDNATNTIINRSLNEIWSWANVFNFFEWSTAEYFMSEGDITYQRLYNDIWYVNSFSWYLSYISLDSNSNNVLHNIPQNIYNISDYTQDGKIYAYISWTWSNERIYYYIWWELFFENDPAIIWNSTIQTVVWIVTNNNGSWLGWSWSTYFQNFWSWWNGTTSWTWNIQWTYTTQTGAVSYDSNIWNWDANGDGSVWILDGEIFVWIANMFKYFFEKLVDFFGNIKALIEKLGWSFTSEVKTLSFIPGVHAYSGVNISSYFNNNVDQVAYKQTTLWKIDTLIKWFIAFFILVVGLAFFIWINRRKND